MTSTPPLSPEPPRPAGSPQPSASSASPDAAAAALDHTVQSSPLGKHADYVDQYCPALLYPIARAQNRSTLSPGTRRPAHGVDLWTAHELSWLDRRGKPKVATATIQIPADSPYIIESKSFKLYLNSLNQTPVEDSDTLRALIQADLSAAAGGEVQVTLHHLRTAANSTIGALGGVLLDDLDVECDRYQPDATLLAFGSDQFADETLVSDLLKSNCPVTGQPDWASVQIRYAGRSLDHASVLRYLVSFRQHAGFHEHCVERIFDDIMRQCGPDRLTVYARYTRRGGLDINPWRSTEAEMPGTQWRDCRQ